MGRKTKSKIKAEKNSQHILRCKNLTLGLITRTAFYVTAVGDFAAEMLLNKISQAELPLGL